MTERHDDVAQALVQVRRAYRLVWAYQRRLLDLLEAFGASLKERHPQLQFFSREPVGYSQPPRGDVDPTAGYWSWNFLPFYRCDLSWVTSSKVEPGALFVGVTHYADTGYPPGARSEPDALQFPAAEQCSTWIHPYVMSVGASVPKGISTWLSLIEAIGSTGEGKEWDHHIVEPCVFGKRVAYSGLPIHAEDLASPELVKQRLTQPVLDLVERTIALAADKK